VFQRGNAYIGNNIEHSVIDAMVFVTMTEWVMFNEMYVNGDVLRDAARPPRQLQQPMRLQWNVEDMKDAIDKAVDPSLHWHQTLTYICLLVVTARGS
jgi:hypothetical protein